MICARPNRIYGAHFQAASPTKVIQNIFNAELLFSVFPFAWKAINPIEFFTYRIKYQVYRAHLSRVVENNVCLKIKFGNFYVHLLQSPACI